MATLIITCFVLYMHTLRSFSINGNILFDLSMIDLSTLSVFVLAVFALVISPGPAVFYILARTIEQGRKAGIVSILGIGAGTVCHIIAATVGLSALFMSSALAFNLVKYAGACYLIYLGIKTLGSQGIPDNIAVREVLPLSKIFYQALLVNLLNPKTTLFFFAFLPQFVNPNRGAVAIQILVLGLIIIAIGFISDLIYVLLAGSISGWLRRDPGKKRVQQYIAGGTYITLGIAAAFTGLGTD